MKKDENSETVIPKEIYLPQLIDRITQLREHRKQLIAIVRNQHSTIAVFGQWLDKTNGQNCTVLETCEKGNLNNGAVRFLEEDFPKEIERISDFGQKAIELNRATNALRKLEESLLRDYKLELK